MQKRMDWEKLLSTKRVSEFALCQKPPKKSQYKDPRSPFERDCDQITFSYPFRRLQDKTQVIPFPEYDFVHTRLTHSHEVACVGRSFGKLAFELIANELDEKFMKETGLCAADIGALIMGACLAHDIGNPPFGHSGENSISYYFKENSSVFEPGCDMDDFEASGKHSISLPLRAANGDQIGEKDYTKEELLKKHKCWADLSDFEGNANGFRIITRNCEKGINPTAALLGTFTKYPRESYLLGFKDENKTSKGLSKYGFFYSEREVFKQLSVELGLLKVHGVADSDLAYHRHPLAFLMEASDDIAYGIIDFEDGCWLGLIDYDKGYGNLKVKDKDGKITEVSINGSPLEIFASIAELDESYDPTRVSNATNNRDAMAYLRSKVINVLTQECFKIFRSNYEDIMCGKYQKALIDDITNSIIVSGLSKMKNLIRKYVYNSGSVLQSEASGFDVMYTLIDSLAISSSLCISCGDTESERAKKLRSLLPEEYSPKVEKELKALTEEEIYERVMLVLDYVSGMTDNFAMSLYRRMKGISHK